MKGLGGLKRRNAESACNGFWSPGRGIRSKPDPGPLKWLDPSKLWGPTRLMSEAVGDAGVRQIARRRLVQAEVNTGIDLQVLGQEILQRRVEADPGSLFARGTDVDRGLHRSGKPLDEHGPAQVGDEAIILAVAGVLCIAQYAEVGLERQSPQFRERDRVGRIECELDVVVAQAAGGGRDLQERQERQRLV